MSSLAAPDAWADTVRRLRGDDWMRTTAHTWGLDAETGIEVQVDAASWPVDFRIEEIPDEARTWGGLTDAVRRAISAATIAQLAADRLARGLSAERLQRARDALAGRLRLTAPRIPRRGPIQRLEAPVQGPRTMATGGRSRIEGRSLQGEVTVVANSTYGLTRIGGDEEFLARCRPDALRFALREAFGSAGRPEEGHR